MCLWSAGVKLRPPGGAHVTGGLCTGFDAGGEASASGAHTSAKRNASATPRLTTATTL
jgi:hypothetical protein